MMTSILSNDLAYAIAWTLIHALWQITLIAALLALVLKLMTKAGAAHRYIVGFSALGLSLLASLITFTIYFIDTSNVSANVVNSLQYQTMLPSTVSINTLPSLMAYVDQYILLIVNVWIIGSIIFFVKTIGGFIYLKSLLKNSKLENIKLLKATEKLSKKFGIHRVINIKESHQIATPMVMGFIKPIILFPLGLVNQLSTDEVNAILAHELAHIKRHDYIFNLIQVLAEIIFYFHPGIWYISSRIRIERENCCDDMAIAYTRNSISYAKTLVKLQDIQSKTIGPALAFSGNKKLFTNRILRILNQPGSVGLYKDKLMAVLLLFTSLFVGADNFGHKTSNTHHDNYDVYVIDDCPQSPEDIKYYLDTIPERNTFHIKKKTDKKELELEMENGEIINLKIDGKKIDKNDFDKHKDILKELTPNQDKNIITLFPDCGEDFGNVYLLEKLSRNAINMDSLLDNLSSKSFRLRELMDKKANGFTFEDFDKEWMDSIAAGMHIYNLSEKMQERIDFPGDSIWDFFPKKFPRILEMPGDNIDKHRFENLLEKELENLEERYDGIDKESLNRFRYELRKDNDLKNLLHDELRTYELKKHLDDQKDNRHDLHKELEFYFDNNDGKNIFRFDNKDKESIFKFDNKDNKFIFESGPKKASDVIAKHLSKDKLIDVSENNKIELTGKFLKINGDKQPKNIWKKYKEIYQENTGIELTKDSKIKFEIQPNQHKNLFF